MRKSYSLEELAKLTHAKLVGEPTLQISGVENLEEAQAHQISFLDNSRFADTSRYKKLQKETQAAALIVHPSTHLIEESNYLLHETPSFAFQQIIELFYSTPSSGFSDIHPTAVIHEEANLAPTVTVGPRAVIDRGVTIGEHTQIEAGAVIEAECQLGEHCHIHPNAVVHANTQIGNRVVIQSGAIIGASGFGYHTDQKGVHHPLNQLGNVILEDDVDIGANTTIDRARFKTTFIGQGTKIDNLVQIGHQVRLGRHNLVVAQVGIAGSTETGQNVVFGGQAGVVGHIKIADGAIFAARSAVSKPITKGGIYSGAPAIPIKEFNRQFVMLRNVDKLAEKLKKIEKIAEQHQKGGWFQRLKLRFKGH